MKSEIPPEKTKAYWEKAIPDLYKQNQIVNLKKELKTFLFVLPVYPVLILWDGGYPFWFWTALIIYLFCMIGYTVFHLSGVVKIHLHKETNPLISQEVVFTQVKGTLWGLCYDSEPESYPINKHFPEDITAFSFWIYYKYREKSLRRQRILCIGTEEKFGSIENLIHMKEGLTLRKESRRFRVTYKKYSKELVRIDLCDDETYPAHCGYEELTERINIMF